MKNKILFFVLIIFCGAIYLFDELAQTRRDELSDKKSRLFDPEKLGEIRSIKTPGIKLTKKNGFFYTQNETLVDADKLDYFFDRLSQIRIKRILKKSELKEVNTKVLFPNLREMVTFTFQQEKLSFLLGKKLDVDQSFYMEVQRKTGNTQLIAYDPSFMDGPYLKKDEATSPRKYFRLKTLLSLDDKYFKDNHIFKKKYFKDIVFSKASVSNIRNRPFSLNFSTKTSTPETYPELPYLQNAFLNFQNSIKSLMANESYYSFTKKKLKEKLSTMILEASGKSHQLQLFRRYGKLSGYFVMTSFDKVLYEIDGKSASLFFLNVQDFWDRRPLPFQFGMKDELFEMSFDEGNRLKLKLPYRKGFHVLMDDKNEKIRPVKKNFISLFSLLIRQADHVSQSDILDLKKVKSKIQLYFDGFVIHAMLKNNELLLFNQVKKIIYHYRTDDSVKLNMEDYFYNAGSLL